MFPCLYEMMTPTMSFHFFRVGQADLKQDINAGFIHLAFFRSIFTQLWHLEQITFTGFFDFCKLASRIPMYVHSWLQW
jgi:hypothetical protein